MTQIQTNVSLILVPEVKLNFSATNPPGGTVRFMWTNPATGNLDEVASETNTSSSAVTASTAEGPGTARILVAYLDDGTTVVTEANKGKGNAHGHNK